MKTTTADLDVLLFDLGGVLVELGGMPRMHAWLEHAHDDDGLWERWLRSPAVRRFERGHCTAQEFALAMIDEFRLPVPPEEFLAEFEAWPRGLYEGVLPLLSALRTSYTLACFSNNNTLHWDRICLQMGLGSSFTHHFASHLIGYLKPDREAFEYVLAQLGSPPERVLFLDDNALNIETARSVGMQARRTVGFSAVLQALEDYGIIR